MSHSEPADKRLHAQLATRRQRIDQLAKQLAEQSLAPEQVLKQDRLASLGTATIPLGRKLTDSLNGMYMLVQLLERRLTKLGVNMDGPREERGAYENTRY